MESPALSVNINANANATTSGPSSADVDASVSDAIISYQATIYKLEKKLRQKDQYIKHLIFQNQHSNTLYNAAKTMHERLVQSASAYNKCRLYHLSLDMSSSNNSVDIANSRAIFVENLNELKVQEAASAAYDEDFEKIIRATDQVADLHADCLGKVLDSVLLSRARLQSVQLNQHPQKNRKRLLEVEQWDAHRDELVNCCIALKKENSKMEDKVVALQTQCMELLSSPACQRKGVMPPNLKINLNASLTALSERPFKVAKRASKLKMAKM